MKIVFITPASGMRRFALYRLGNNLYGHPNSITGPLILGHILKNAGHEVEVYEELYDDLPFEKIAGADVYCLYTMTSSAPRAYFLADRIHREFRARVLIGGIHASALPEEAAEHADQVIVGEGESVILDVVEGRVTDQIVRAECTKDLDSIPFPDYSLLKTRCEAANVMSTRGCPFRCSFCTTSRMFHPYRKRSVESVIQELRYYKKLGFKYMNFEDDNFTADRERAKEICRRMIAENLVFRETFFFGRTDLAGDEEMLELLQRAHLSRVLVGIESLNQASLDLINKHQKISDIRRCAAALSRHKIRLIASLVLGIDTDCAEDIRNGVQFAKSINAYQLQPAVMTPFPGTPVYDQLEKQNRMLTHEWSLFDMLNVTFIPNHLSPWALQKEFFRAVRQFYSFLSSFKIMRIFGLQYGLRRLGLCFLMHLGMPFAYGIAYVGKNTHYYKLKHMEKKPEIAANPT
ncbi:B12-binding domain-containing radical SAM protein [Papillibacter cinnamivorans]|uniref:Radical SAM superfamily enzyme YgiQ, UPF0313 family n=1 Tax=Papillibacter cinnamivorans DSM 12816 TaxID=1122930 RepID=A0A1W2BU51_9FIRM|nr:radical SAM protein [Papillibacter cinnamivorans]SMC76122.1 Radical SAM superfamily enzyme YgiQ, UPF0313 family [Papillibacter cinnamivorans DSM 12816]